MNLWIIALVVGLVVITGMVVMAVSNLPADTVSKGCGCGCGMAGCKCSGEAGACAGGCSKEKCGCGK